MNDIDKIMNAIKLAQNLKMELRHSWLSNGRQESVAEHTWRMAFMAMLVAPYIKNINQEKLIKMIIIHDLVEAIAGDTPAFNTLHETEAKIQKEQMEFEAALKIKNILPQKIGEEIFNLWLEFEKKETYEAKVANALDKLEVQIQHNEANISTWLEIEYEMVYKMSKHVNFDSFLNQLKDIVEKEGEEKMIESGIEVEKYKNI
ncbi:putative hydrolase of HD superfamily [Anoxybacillus mongoliensis]|uniref:Putative hydrolase of HD superfamily n=1 Tax=Anoxybacillus mongoliensis TaxID=452565 RepID=A0A7W8JEM7_9BACL|nr:HD domain-containing protein [Anoxybacillus mongoliensis]MBB5354363.1 putative hydrolase of HD superfamily [Anoxybacillus mongoliensis]